MESVHLICLVLFATLSVTTAKHLYEPRIINGQNATEGQFPHMVSLRANIGHYCGASILSSRFLLTAAHCCVGRYAIPKYVIAIVGSYRQSGHGVAVKLEKITAHEKFDFGDMALGRYDVGLIRTATEITFTDLIQPIALPKADVPQDRSVKVVLSGWGDTKVHSWPSWDVIDTLQYIELDTINNTDCRNRFANIPKYEDAVQKENLCTMKKDGGICQGDSGGALIDVSDPNHKTVVGITSWTYACAKGYPDVFTRVYSHLDWIHEQIEKQSAIL